MLKLFEPGSYDLVPHDGMRKIIARRLTESKQTIPHFYVAVDVTLDNLLALRERLNLQAPKDKDGKPAWKVSVNDFIIKAMAMALIKVPDANVSWTDSAMVKHKHADIGVAVSIPGGLITPIVRKAETKGLAQISPEMKDYAARAKTRKLKPEEYTGGSAAVSNMGMMNVKNFQAIVNPPHAHDPRHRHRRAPSRGARQRHRHRAADDHHAVDRSPLRGWRAGRRVHRRDQAVSRRTRADAGVRLTIMKSILAFGDSSPGASSPAPGSAMPSRIRWPNALAAGLGGKARVIEEGMNGRTTVFPDPTVGAERNGAVALPMLLTTHQPLDLVIIMLGTNDIKYANRCRAFDASMGMARLIEIVQRFPWIKTASAAADPHHVAAGAVPDQRTNGSTTSGAMPSRSRSCSPSTMRASPKDMGVHFFDAGSVAKTDPTDGGHLDAANTRAHRRGAGAGGEEDFGDFERPLLVRRRPGLAGDTRQDQAHS